MTTAKPRKPTKPAKKKTTGRPSSFRPEFVEQGRRIALLGATDEEMAGVFGVNVATLQRWKLVNAEFRDSLKRGKLEADADVADRLHQRALGFEYEKAVPIKLKEVTYSDGKRLKETERVEIVMVHEVVPPDTTAGIFWLKNRRSAQWRDRPAEAGVDVQETTRNAREYARLMDADAAA